MVTLKSGRRLRNESEADAGDATPSTSAAADNGTILRLESTDTDSSLPDIPPLASRSTVHSLVVDLCDDDDDDNDDDVAEGRKAEAEESDEEGPDYEPVWKRAKRNDSAPMPPSRTDSPADTVLYDVSEDASLDADADSDIEEVTFVKVTPKVSKPLIVIDDDDDDDRDNGDGGGVDEKKRGEMRKRQPSSPKKVERRPSGVASEMEEAPSPAQNDKGETPAMGADTTALIEATDAVVSSAIEIIVNDNDGIDDSTSSPPRKRQPVTANVEEIVPEKYRTLYFSFSSTSVTDDSLWTLFTQFGEIETLCLDDVASHVVKREGRVVFKKFYAVDGCIKAKPLTLGITKIDVRRTNEKAEENQHVDKIYVSGIYHLGSVDLERYFSSFGTIKEVIVLSARGFAFVVFDDSDSVEKTLLQHFHLLDGLLLEVKRSFKKNPNPKPRLPPNRFGPPPPPKFDKGPRCRIPTAAVAITPFPRHVDFKPKLDPGTPVPFDRCESATSGSFVSNHVGVVKAEPVFLKTEKG